jgi:hydroxyquinol 1,2-dioxygenase
MVAIDERTITDVALNQMSGTPNPRLREIMDCLVRHLHAFAREGIKFLTAVGQACTPYRQEFILLSDTLGLSSLINTLHDRRSVEVGTKASLLGPFYRQGAPEKKPGESIASPGDGSEISIYERVVNRAGEPIRT